jgi:hypothetical protein
VPSWSGWRKMAGLSAKPVTGELSIARASPSVLESLLAERPGIRDGWRAGSLPKRRGARWRRTIRDGRRGLLSFDNRPASEHAWCIQIPRRQ